MAPNDGEPSQWIDRRSYLRIGGGLAAGGTLALPGCTSDDPGGDDDTDGEITPTGWLATQVTDQPNDIGDFERCVVTLRGVWLGPTTDGNGDESESNENEPEDETSDEEEDAQQGSDTTQNESTSEAAVAGSQPDDPGDGGQGGENETGDETEDETEDGEANEDDEGEDDEEEADDGNGRRYLEFEEPQEADLVQLQGENTQLIDDREIEVGTYQFLQLDVDGVEGVLNDGSEADVETPGNAPLKFNESFDVREDTRTTFTADFTPVRRGNGSYLIQPVASGVEVTYGSVEDGETSGDGDGTGDGGGDGSEEPDETDGSSDGESGDGNETSSGEE